jgi:PAS domain S-box-containing protein
VVLLSAGGPGTGDDPLARVPAARAIAMAANVTVLDRPLRVLTLVSAARTALRARKRQYAAREVFQEHEVVLDAVPAAVFISRDREARDIRGNRYTAEVLRVAPRSNVSKTAQPEERPRSFRALKDGVEIAPEDLPVQRVAASGVEVEPELRGMTAEALLERVHPEDRDIPLQQQRAIAAGEEPESTGEYRWKVKSGDYRWFSDSRKLVRDDRGEPVAVVGVTRDITEAKRAETDLRLADQRKSDFLAVLSHELRNPLAPISNSVHILERAQPGGEPAKRALDVLRRQTEHLARLVDDLLDVTRISHGKIELRLERLDARELVARAVEDARHAFEHRGLALWFSGTVDPAWVDADSARVVQMIGNLLNNALKFTPPGGRVEVSVRTEPGTVTVSVRDSGAGITPDELEGIFDPFVQAERTHEQRHGGLGIGLSLVRALAEKHGGSVRAHSDGPGRGATFVLSLPQAAPPRELPWTGTARSSIPPLSILVIEDNEDAAWALRDLLELYGHEVTVATAMVDPCGMIRRSRARRPGAVPSGMQPDNRVC